MYWCRFIRPIPRDTVRSAWWIDDHIDFIYDHMTYSIVENVIIIIILRVISWKNENAIKHAIVRMKNSIYSIGIQNTSVIRPGRQFSRERNLILSQNSILKLWTIFQKIFRQATMFNEIRRFVFIIRRSDLIRAKVFFFSSKYKKTTLSRTLFTDF